MLHTHAEIKHSVLKTTVLKSKNKKKLIIIEELYDKLKVFRLQITLVGSFTVSYIYDNYI